MTVSQYKYDNPNGDGIISLLDDLRQRTAKPYPQQLAQLPEDASVVIYHLSDGEARAIPSGFCHLVLGTEEGMNGHLHQNSILKPNVRLDEIYEVRDKLLANLKFGESRISLANNLMNVDHKRFFFPDVILGNEETLEYDKQVDDPKKFVLERADKIFDPECGFLKPVQQSLDPQYIILPRSVYDTFKDDLINRINTSVNEMFPYCKFDPKVEFYDDALTYKRINYVRFGKKIVETIKKKCKSKIQSHAVIMIPSLKKGMRKHDELAALLIRELKEENIFVSIIHSDTALATYRERKTTKGEVFYGIDQRSAGKFKGYIRNVALIKVLLNNSKYPFALATPLTADLTIGIDVKNNTAGFVFIDKYARNIKREFVASKKKEKLSTNLIKGKIYEAIKKLAQLRELRVIVFHRDGRLFDVEEKGILLAIAQLKREGILAEDVQFSIVEIPKKSMFSFRLFDGIPTGRERDGSLLNPQIGSYFFLNKKTAYVCTTGKEFLRNGTSKPLQVNYCIGNVDSENVLEDIFYLSTLAYTKPDDCSRVPLTIKILDLFLRDVASSYDREQLEFMIEDEIIEVENLKKELNLK